MTELNTLNICLNSKVDKELIIIISKLKCLLIWLYVEVYTSHVHVQLSTAMKVCLYLCANVVDPDESKKEGKDQVSIQSSTTSDPGYQWKSDKFTIRHHKQEPRCQQNILKV